MAEKPRIIVPWHPTVHFIHHDLDKYTIEVELVGVEKENIAFEMSERSFCLKAPKNDVEYFGCWTLAHDVDPKKAKATFKTERLTVTVPLTKPLKHKSAEIEHPSMRIPIE